MWRRENSWPYPEPELRHFGRLACSQSLYRLCYSGSFNFFYLHIFRKRRHIVRAGCISTNKETALLLSFPKELPYHIYITLRPIFWTNIFFNNIRIVQVKYILRLFWEKEYRPLRPVPTVTEAGIILILQETLTVTL
jgi:hypothetical protein